MSTLTVPHQAEQQNAATYTQGEDQGRLKSAAKYFGIKNTRTPLKSVREAQPNNPNPNTHSRSILKFGSTVWSNVGLLFSDSTLEAARMHSVGVTAQEERIAGDGTLHLMSISKRKKGTKPTYEDLMGLFHQKPLEPLEYELEPIDEEEYEEVMLDSVEGGSIVAAIFGIIKGMVGPAVLYLPRGFALSGFAVAIPAMIIATITYVYSATRLLQCWKAESDKIRLSMEKMEEIRLLLDPNAGEYGGSAAYGSVENGQKSSNNKMLTYPELARRAFGKASFLISGGIAAMQFGVCLTYLIFVPQNLFEATKTLFGVEVPKQIFLVLMLAVEIPLCWVRDIRKLTPINILATALIAFGLVSVLAIALFDPDPNLDNSGSENNSFEEDLSDLFQQITLLPRIQPTWVLFIGTSFFCFEGSITLLVPLQEAVYKREDRKRFPYVNQKVTSSIVAFYIFFSVICW
jgi:proton-coupled amino acid transporter